MTTTTETDNGTEKNGYTLIRKDFPKLRRNPDGSYTVDPRSRKWGFEGKSRKQFKTLDEAHDYRKQIQEQVKRRGAERVDAPKDVLIRADAYQSLVDRLKPHGRTPEEAVEHYIKFLGAEIVRLAKPTVGKLVDDWQTYKSLEKDPAAHGWRP